MATQRISSLGVVSSRWVRALASAGIGRGAVVACGALVGCASVLGIEEATCDVSFDTACATVAMLQTGGGNGGSATAAAAGSSAAGSSAAGSGPAGMGGTGGAAVGSGGAAGTSSIEVPPPPPPEPTLCETYCSTIATACTGEYEQYASPAGCKAVCEKLEPGAPDGINSNTVQCRLARAILARDSGEPDNYCHLAGPGGGGVCGSDCSGFCTVMAKTCTTMGSYDACMPQCENVPNLAEAPPPTTAFYHTAIDKGDSVQCRLFHVTAATLDAFTHCEHASGAAVCATF